MTMAVEPAKAMVNWIPARAGMTKKGNGHHSNRKRSKFLPQKSRRDGKQKQD
jgi:hypothetical protein